MTLSFETKKLQDQEWLDRGIDVWLIRDNLKLSFEERVAQHEFLLCFIDELNQIGMQNRAKSPGPSQIVDSKSR